MPILMSLSLIFWLRYNILMASKQLSSVEISTSVKERISLMHSGKCFWRTDSNPFSGNHRQRTKKVVVWTKHITSLVNQCGSSALHRWAPHPSLTMMQSWLIFGISTEQILVLLYCTCTDLWLGYLEIPDGCDVSAELSLDAHQLYSLSGGPLNVLTVEIITATVSFQMVLVFQLSWVWMLIRFITWVEGHRTFSQLKWSKLLWV